MKPKISKPLSLHKIRSEAFYHHCLELISLGYQELPLQELHDAEEPAVTGELVRVIQELIDDAKAPDWVDGFSVRDNPPLNTQDRKGKNRLLVDIQFEYTSRPRQFFHIEAKWIGQSPKPSLGSSKGYLGKEGIGCFLDGRYPATNGRAGMLAYVHTDNSNIWAAKIKKLLTQKAQSLHLKTINKTAWQKVSHGSLSNVYTSVHTPPTLCNQLHIIHILLLF